MADNVATKPAAIRPLRIVPAVVLLAVMAITRFCPAFVNDVSRELFMLMVFGPVLASLGLLIWWAFFSRANGKERLWGSLSLLALIIAGFPAMDESMRSMFYMTYVLPTAMPAFVVAVACCDKFAPTIRLPIGLTAALLGFAGWAMIRNEGMSGSYDAKFCSRFSETEEEKYLRSLAQSKDQAKRATVEPLGVVSWPQFRGPNRDAVVPGVALAEDWAKQPPKQVWTRQIGPGWSSFALAGSRLFTQEQRGQNEVVVCLDALTGVELWKSDAAVRFYEAIAGPGPRATPTIADGKLYTLGAMGLLQCLEPTTGKVVWQKNLLQEKQSPPIWGFSSSPLVVDGLVIVHAGGSEEHAVKAYDAATGEPRWSLKADDSSYSSPHLATINGKPLVLMLTGAGLLAIDPQSGKQAWDYEWKYAGYRAVQPLVLGGGDIVIGSHVGAGTRRISYSPDAEKPFTVKWTTNDMRPDYNDFVALDKFLYGYNKDRLCCINLETGTKTWTGGKYGKGQVLLLPDKAQLLVLAESGELALVHANPEKLEEVAKIQALDGKTWNHPILAGNRLFVRNGEWAACYELPLATAEPKADAE